MLCYGIWPKKHRFEAFAPTLGRYPPLSYWDGAYKLSNLGSNGGTGS